MEVRTHFSSDIIRIHKRQVSQNAEKKPLTDRQAEVFSFIKNALESSRRPPTVREIGEKFNISSTNGVRSILSALIKKNYIQLTPKVSRGIDQDDSICRFANQIQTLIY